MEQLEWLVTLPEQDTITIRYDNTSNQNTPDFLPFNITSRLIEFRVNEGVKSEIVLIILQNVPMSGTIIECRSKDLDSDIEVVYTNTSGI